ncbi:MAG: tRNA1(Val) (adenine(37)-N6)-methyltransferase [Psychroflexus halocasei]
MSEKPFRFKEFTIHHQHAAMKVGTDAVLLGAWAKINDNTKSILDVGSGTGIIALQLAQRSYAEQIDGIELDDDAFEECVYNFEESPWSDRLFCYHASFQEFTEEVDETYDLIVSNPPYFKKQNNLNLDLSREKARFQDALTFEELIFGVKKFLSQKGNFSVIIPAQAENEFLKIAEKYQLYPSDILNIKGRKETEIKRSLINLTYTKTETQISELVIENARHDYTDDYVDLVKDFYLKM